MNQSLYNLTQHYFKRIYKLNPKLNAFITITEQEALLTATQLDSEIETAQVKRLLHGIPIVIKDNIDTANLITTIGTELFQQRIPVVDADIVTRLKQAGAIILGKTNLSEFGADITGNNRFYGNVRSAVNPNYSPGGSSSGTATAVAANLCVGGIGTDTGGSIRVPASWSGIVGLRPTQSIISTDGVFKRAPSFDTVGVMASKVTDVEILFNAIMHPLALPNILPPPSTYKLGVINNYTFRGVDTEVAAAIHRVIYSCKQAGIEVINIESILLSNFNKTNYSIIALYEFSQVLQEYQNQHHLFGDKVNYDLRKSAAISGKSYQKAQKQRLCELGDIQNIFRQVDAIITPTTPTTAPNIQADARVYQLNRKFVLPFSYFGLPCVSIPCGLNPQGLPIGLQIVANSFQDKLILKIAEDLESIINYYLIK
ncbi:amidase [Calothrix sp. HK-06]|nr:amidase [Calothrix sp. HK-06]